MTPLRIAAASLDAFVIVAAASVVGNLLACWIARWWAKRRHVRAWDRFVSEMRAAKARRCEHLRNRELCDDCNNNPKGT